jgi:hypothetical protein
MAPDRDPVAVGLKVALILQLLCAARLLPQLLVWAKSPGSVPLMVIRVIETALAPVFVSVIEAVALLVPTF